jgi:hypothetical protein
MKLFTAFSLLNLAFALPSVDIRSPKHQLAKEVWKDEIGSVEHSILFAKLNEQIADEMKEREKRASKHV